MTINIDRYQRKLARRISDFHGHFMSDSKWTKVFTALSQNNNLIEKCLIKSIPNSILQQIDIPSLKNFGNTFDEKGIKDVMLGGPIPFKEIEWIEFPVRWTQERQMRNYTLEPLLFHQDINEIKNIMDKVGQLETDVDSDQLKIYGYRGSTC